MESQSPSSFYLSFHQNDLMNDFSSSHELRFFLKSVLSQRFPSEMIHEVQLGPQESREIVFRVDVPPLLIKPLEQKTLEDLLWIFEKLEDYTPHFTHVTSTEEDRRFA